MTAYCPCEVCRKSPAQPAQGSANANPEVVAGKLVHLADGDSLAHWSKKRFARMMSTEIAEIKIRGVNPKAVSASFYLYRAPSAPPAGCPPQLKQLGLGGKERYLIGSDVAREASIYLKMDDSRAANPEVVVVLGCGGYIQFDDNGNATGITRNEPGLR
jgi:hypothetical protein